MTDRYDRRRPARRADFRAALDSLGCTREDFGRTMGKTEKAVAAWLSGGPPDYVWPVVDSLADDLLDTAFELAEFAADSGWIPYGKAGRDFPGFWDDGRPPGFHDSAARMAGWICRYRGVDFHYRSGGDSGE